MYDDCLQVKAHNHTGYEDLTIQKNKSKSRSTEKHELEGKKPYNFDRNPKRGKLYKKNSPRPQ